MHVLRELRRVHKPGAPVIMVLGDSAPYGVYVDTPALIGRLALDCGFTRYECLTLRERGIDGRLTVAAIKFRCWKRFYSLGRSPVTLKATTRGAQATKGCLKFPTHMGE